MQWRFFPSDSTDEATGQTLYYVFDDRHGGSQHAGPFSTYGEAKRVADRLNCLMRVHFSASEAQMELGGPIDPGQPAQVEIIVPSDGIEPFVQFTYGSCRIAPDETIAFYEEGLWRLAADLKVASAWKDDGVPVDTADLQTRGMLFTDITITAGG